MTSMNSGANSGANGEVAALRISDADRNGTLRRLHNAVALGLIDIDEFEERSGAVSQARLHSELAALVEDLPGLREAFPSEISERCIARPQA